MDIELLISHFSYLAIFILMLLNGIINFPSSQLLYVVVGYFVGTGTLSLPLSILAGGTGNAIGNILTFLLIKKYDRPLARKLLFLDEKMFDKVMNALHATFKEKGMWWIFFGKLIPSIKAFIAIIAGLAKLPTPITSCIFFITSYIWAGAIIMIGYSFGKAVSLSYLPIVSLVVASIVIIIVYKKFSKQLAG